jgi:hypothetical protein
MGGVVRVCGGLLNFSNRKNNRNRKSDWGKLTYANGHTQVGYRYLCKWLKFTHSTGTRLLCVKGSDTDTHKDTDPNCMSHTILGERGSARWIYCHTACNL